MSSGKNIGETTVGQGKHGGEIWSRKYREGNTGLNPRALEVQIPAFAGREFWGERVRGGDGGESTGLEIRVFRRAIVCCADRGMGSEAFSGKNLTPAARVRLFGT